jgi:hypothetical protein
MRIARVLLNALLPLSIITAAPLPDTAATTNTQMSITHCRAILAQPGGVLIIGNSITALGFDDITARFTAAGKHV